VSKGNLSSISIPDLVTMIDRSGPKRKALKNSRQVKKRFSASQSGEAMLWELSAYVRFHHDVASATLGIVNLKQNALLQ
jgi:hypothetical protein